MSERELEVAILATKTQLKQKPNSFIIRFLLKSFLYFDEIMLSFDRIFDYYKIKRILAEPTVKITIALILNMTVLHLVLNNTLVAATISKIENEKTAINNLIQNEIDIDALSIDEKTIQTNFLTTSKEQCNQSQANKQSSELCGKDQIDEGSAAILKTMEQKEKARIARLAVTRKIVRKISCREDIKGADYSDTKGKHIDEDCCPDPDEWPKPGCVYSAAGYALMLKGPRK